MSIGRYFAAFAALGLVPTHPAAAEALVFPAPATETGALEEPLSRYALPVAAWDGQGVPARVVEGALERRAWRLDAPATSTQALLSGLRGQLVAAGYEVVFQCEAATCGGFDFRYATDLLPEPDMHVDLGDFHFLSMARGEAVLGLMVSRSSAAAFVQMTRVEPVTPPAANPGAIPHATGPVVRPATSPPPDPAARLSAEGGLVLDDLRFQAGASALEEGRYPSLLALADWLSANRARRVALVGHTDAAGGLEMNVAISRKRAEAVRAALIDSYGVDEKQLSAEGVGFLAPRATNATEEGRARNRRVEAVVVVGG